MDHTLYISEYFVMAQSFFCVFRHLICFIQFHFYVIYKTCIFFQTQHNHRTIPVFGKIHWLTFINQRFNLRKFIS